ncbi:MAG: FAD-binding oxidoreductase [Sphingomonadales bacterium]|nr:FAD-binding oxidoreductase [Sphingomonadales bacterium]PIX64593.1 MAG: FAD-binding oxidoreductase [Sphingomonadales bacterium CG_4_10_14_3_um_filter_58_15]NCO48361.1 FAD-binding oxidoreductase [Sphingomonadales bacterium]NCO99155.1 FAD-binding oxidoreductase [Sphingomonadales bacterium]NCP26911.1 FAD-binding oxidoreductase [Sphingomonadales bacterium]
MELTLPPRVSPAQFDNALKAYAAVVGKDWVLATDQDRDAYSDIYAPGPETEWPASAAVAPQTREEIQAIMRIANEYKTPLWPVSRGKNLGYGTAAPRLPGSIVLDLSRMLKIEELNTELGYCVIEPGVSFFDLYEHIQRAKAPLWMSVPGNAWGSVLGNALDHGMGYTPYGQHARNLCGIEAVLPDGEVMRTGMGAMDNNHSWHLFPLSFGPDWTHMFTQSNMGVVTKAGVWLQPAPDTSLQLTYDIPNEEDIGWVVDTITPLKTAGVIEQNVFIPSWLGKIVLKGQRKDFWDKEGAIPESRVQELLKEHKLGYWQVQIRFYGDETLNKAKADIVKKAFKRHIDTPPMEVWWQQGDPINQYDPTMGMPSAIALQMGDWVGGRGAHMGFSPVVPATSKHVLGQLKRSRKIIADHDVDFYASFTIGGRFATNINMLMYDRDKPTQVENIRKMFSALIRETAEAGYGEYRTHLGWMDEVNQTYDFNDGAQRRLNEKLKDAIDPNGILAPGKQGVWPAAYRDEAKGDNV